MASLDGHYTFHLVCKRDTSSELQHKGMNINRYSLFKTPGCNLKQTFVKDDSIQLFKRFPNNLQNQGEN